jgi:hypothetical protein
MLLVTQFQSKANSAVLRQIESVLSRQNLILRHFEHHYFLSYGTGIT